MWHQRKCSGNPVVLHRGCSGIFSIAQYVSYFRSNPLFTKFVCIWLKKYSIGFDQTSVKSRSVYFEKIEKNHGVTRLKSPERKYL